MDVIFPLRPPLYRRSENVIAPFVTIAVQLGCSPGMWSPRRSTIVMDNAVTVTTPEKPFTTGSTRGEIFWALVLGQAE